MISEKKIKEVLHIFSELSQDLIPFTVHSKMFCAKRNKHLDSKIIALGECFSSD